MFPTANGKIPVHPSYDFSLRQNPLTKASNAREYDKMPIFFTNISLYLRNGYT